MTHLTLTTTQNKSIQYLAIAGILAATMILPEVSFAADAFEGIHTKITGWVSGTAGKLITFICFAMAGIMGVAGFPTKYILGAMGTGLLLSSSGSLVDMMFA